MSMDDPFDQQFAPNPIGVYWDVDESSIPDRINVSDVAQNIKLALRNTGCIGPVLTMMAYGDTSQIDKDAFDSAGITLIHVPASEGKDKRVEKIQLGMMNWVLEHRDDNSNMLLILGDMSHDFQFINSLNHLRMQNFNIILSQPPGVTGAILANAPFTWEWPSLAAGGAPLLESVRSEREDIASDFDNYYSDGLE